ncbi:MAG: NADH-quinone oxidoreductase subunit J [Candidatus Marinimicrobia bacterium]|nr:NADH-quinone oxidoreductase subunit J [Candidatus Neomarinimicrobiota bacterium]MDP6456140.1 NADH-quinone oxidoreductase subunit J [Candidatus Neomarinimicrobiota bacterium]MDP6836821.1 NADH-quinone oxidoreductase subunit J [Candidatus Neomarinimicrobiota bacterium]MDP6966971.1 NADH-quinone oxidoreductase subunit J [Candidatus Neomarinimicrobiota bacterium]
MTGADFVFWFVVLLTVGSAFVVVRSQNLIYSAVALLFTFLGVAGLYVFMMADFIAVTQVVIYVGGILVLIIFGIMLTHKMVDVRLSHTSMQQGIGWLLALLIIAGLVRMITSSPWFLKSTPESEETVAGIGRLLMIDYLLPFEIASVLLLAALIGAAMLARKEN